MSVLQCHQPCLYPQDLLATQPLQSPPRQWNLLHTKPRHEKALARELLHRAIPFYLPLIDKTAVHGGRQVTSRVPLFPGYVFLFGDESERRECAQNHRVLRLLDAPDGDRLLSELRQVQRIIAHGAPLSAEARLCCGQRARITQGPLDGLEGTLLVRRGETRIVIGLAVLQKGASLAVNGHSVEYIETPRRLAADS